VLAVDAKTGILSPTSSSTLPGFSGCTVDIDQTGKFLYTATSVGISAFTVSSTTGALSSIGGSPFFDGIDLRESAIHPSGKFVYAISNTIGSNTISVFSINSSSGALTPVAG